MKRKRKTKEEYVDNDVWRYSIQLRQSDLEKTIYTKVFPEYVDLPKEEREKYDDSSTYYYALEDLIKQKYFTPERIQEYKDLFCKMIQESDDPFYISCVDIDGGYNVTKDDLFNVDD